VAIPGMTEVSGDVARQHGSTPLPRGVSDRRLNAVPSTDFTRLMHTDSGFDEHMVDELTLDDTMVPGIAHMAYDTNVNAYDNERKDESLHEREELPESASLHTPLASSPMAVERKSEGRQEQQRDYDS